MRILIYFVRFRTKFYSRNFCPAHRSPFYVLTDANNVSTFKLPNLQCASYFFSAFVPSFTYVNICPVHLSPLWSNYWRDEPRHNQPELPLPTTYEEPYTLKQELEIPEGLLTAYADSDWGTCWKTRNAVSGAAIMVAGGVVGYKTKFHHTIALSSIQRQNWWQPATSAK
jgi:hypothetical protein